MSNPEKFRTAGLGEKRKPIIMVEDELRRVLHPPAFWSVIPVARDRHGYCLVDVPSGRDRPYTVGGSIFVRKGKATESANPDTIRNLVESDFSGMERWERRLIPSAGLERLDGDSILATAQEAKKKRNYRFPKVREDDRKVKKIEGILSDLGLFRKQTITQAAEVLFGLSPASQFPQVRVRVTVYDSNKVGSTFLDNRQFEGAAFQMLEEVFSMIRQHTPIRASFRGGLQRMESPAYPEEAVREGLVNAFVHRDYANYSGGISVDLYPDRLVIWNAGKLPPGLNIGDLKREHPSMPRNPDIAQVFFLRSYMERVGRGTQKIVSECEAAGLPLPVWKADVAGITLTFRTRAKAASAKLNLRERKLLDDIQPGEKLRLPEYCERLAVSDRQGRRDLGNLVENGWLVREGDGPSTFFVRTEKAWNPAKPGQNQSV